MTQQARSLATGCALFYLFLVALVAIRASLLLDGHFVYALDDPYIHLALAENLAHGHYGINPGEVASPSSSVLWPFLLVPFAGTAFHLYLPFVLNVLFGTAAAALIGLMVVRWPPLRGMSTGQMLVTGGLVVLCANLVGLAYVGMEHSLQVLLAVACAFGVAEAMDRRPVPSWCLAAACVAPSVRYESLGLTLAVALALVGQRRARAAGWIFGLSLLPLAAFAGFLLLHGLPALPMSVVVKASAMAPGPLGQSPATLLVSRIFLTLTSADRLPILVLTLTFAALARGERRRGRRLALVGVTAAGTLQLVLGGFGWLHRYEVYALIFLLLLLLKVLAERERMLFGYFALGLLMTAATYLAGVMELPRAMQDIYDQQFQMHRFVTEYYSGDYAVNDLGMLSFDRRPGTYVLDLWGLGSLDAARHPGKEAAWMSSIARRKATPLAMLFPLWFHIPPGWTPLAEMCITRAVTIIVSDKCVVFYSTEPAADGLLRGELERFRPTLPKEVQMQFWAMRDGVGGWLPADRLP